MNEMALIVIAVAGSLLIALMTWLITGLYFVEQLRVMERIAEEALAENAKLKKEEKREVSLSAMPQTAQG